MNTSRFGLILRIALLVVCVEVVAFSLLGWFYVDRYSSALDERVRARLHLVGKMIGSEELAVSALSRKALISELVGAPALGSMAVGGNGRVIVATDPLSLGRLAGEVPGFEETWLADSAPAEQFLAGKDVLTGVMRLRGEASDTPLYTTVITISTAEINAQKRQVALWGQIGSLLFILLSSAAIVLITQRFITRRVKESLAVLKEVEGGAMEARIPVTSEDELGQLQRGINSMTDKVGALLCQHRRNEEELNAILNAIGDGVIAIGADGAVLRCNPGAAVFLGMEGGASSASEMTRLFPELAREDSERWWHAPESLTGQARLEFERLGADGRLRSIELGHSPIRDDDGAVVGAVLVLQDVTERKQAEKKIRATSNLLDSIVENIPNMIFLKRASDLRFVLFNKAGEQLLGFDRKDLLGRNDYDFFPSEQADFFTAKDREVLASDTVLNISEEPIETRGGERRILHTKKLALRNEHGEAEYLLGISEDITEIRRNAEELERHRHHLEQLVDERTAELSRAKEAAETANRAKSAFLSNMSHELRTPLNAILGFAQLMARDQRIPPEQGRNLATINRAGKHLLSLINDVLEITRIEAGRATLEQTPFDLDAALVAVEEIIRVRADSKGLGLTVERGDGLPSHVLGDAHRLRQVLINLLGNAVKYTDDGHVILRIVAPEEGRIRFEVSDTGPGIAPEEQERIFQAFYQTAAGAAKGEGTGLGLAISREFVHLMGGELMMESVPGTGSTFSFTIPLPQVSAPEQAETHGRVVGLEAGQPTCRVLVVEDNEDSRELTLRLLESVGLEGFAAENGKKALEVFAAVQPCFIWMDMRMPVMDGYEATRQIRALPGGGNVKIVALTASAFEEDRAAIIAAGCDEVMRKPVEESLFFDIMAKLLGLRFRYEDAQTQVHPAREIDFSRLPAGLCAELSKSAMRLDKEATLAIVEQIRGDYPEEADMILELIENYRYDQLLEKCSGK